MNGRPSQRRRKPYSRESIAHALAHHESRGALLFVSPPEPGRPRWRVRLPDYSTDGGFVELTEAQAWALCLGLRASEIAAQRALTPPEIPCLNEGGPTMTPDDVRTHHNENHGGSLEACPAAECMAAVMLS